MKRTVGFVAVGVLVGVMMGSFAMRAVGAEGEKAAKEYRVVKEYRAQKFVIVDQDGRERGGFGTSSDKGAALYLMSRAGVGSGLGEGAFGEGPFGGGGGPWLRAMVSPNGDAVSVELVGEGEDRADIEVRKGSAPRVVLTTKGGKKKVVEVEK